MSKTKKKLLVLIGGAAITFVSLTVIPGIVNKVARKVYRAQNDTSDIDFDNLGPEIVHKDQDVQNEE